MTQSLETALPFLRFCEYNLRQVQFSRKTGVRVPFHTTRRVVFFFFALTKNEKTFQNPIDKRASTVLD